MGSGVRPRYRDAALIGQEVLFALSMPSMTRRGMASGARLSATIPRAHVRVDEACEDGGHLRVLPPKLDANSVGEGQRGRLGGALSAA